MKHISPLILGKQVDIGEAKSPLPPVENHLPDQEALEDAPLDVHIGISGLFRIWSICWVESLRLGEEKEKEPPHFSFQLSLFPVRKDSILPSLGRKKALGIILGKPLLVQ